MFTTLDVGIDFTSSKVAEVTPITTIRATTDMIPTTKVKIWIMFDFGLANSFSLISDLPSL